MAPSTRRVTRSQSRRAEENRHAHSVPGGGVSSVDDTPGGGGGGSFRKDARKICLLVVLYLLQGVPLGLAMGSMPILLKSKFSYAQIATFSLVSYPYSLKLLWSPIVDSVYLKWFGRRKTWIVPIQLLVGLFMWWIGTFIDAYLAVADGDEESIRELTAIFLVLVFMSATQDIAVDGWALSLLSEDNLSYASTSQTIGLNCGFFLSYTGFLALHSADFCNTYLRVESAAGGLITIGMYMQFWAVCFVVVTAYLLLFVHEQDESDHASAGHGDMKAAYMDMWHVITLPDMQMLAAVLLTSKIGFIANDNVTALKLMEKGFPEEELGLTALINFPLQIVFGYYAAKWSQGDRRLRPWLRSFYGRLAAAVLAMVVVHWMPAVMSSSYFVFIVAASVLSNFMSTVQFVSLGAFFASIADPSIGGTYMTLLNTLSNFGGTYPQYFVLNAVDYFTVSTCEAANATVTLPEHLHCSTKLLRQECKTNGGICQIEQDGYYIVSGASIVLATAILWFFIKPRIAHLERAPMDRWRVRSASVKAL